jgi:predicted TIM-barrel fold metal-dependent hydrolase
LHKLFQYTARQRLAICPLINPESIPQLHRLCSRFPETPVIIDHIARIGMSGRVRDSDVKELCGLARHRETKVKLSAFYALGAKRAPHLDLALLIKRVHEAFGPKRLMWGSDCPFQTQGETYEDSVSLIRDRLDFLPVEDKEWILRRSAEQFFFTA